MNIKFNNGRLAVICDKCRIIIEEDISSERFKTYCELNEKGIKWFCSECSPGRYTQQIQRELFNMLLKEVE